MPEKVLLSVFRKEKSSGRKTARGFYKKDRDKGENDEEKILTILLAAVVLAIPGCSSDTGKGSGKTAENITIETENGRRQTVRPGRRRTNRRQERCRLRQMP